MQRNLALPVLLLAISSTMQAADWPAWRGPSGQGFCEEKNVLLKWSSKDNVKWKIKLAHQGNSTPVVWGDRIFLTQANKGGTERNLLCFACANGKLLWQKDVTYQENERNWNENWYANASPALDGERVVVSFASAGMYCFDFEGKELWKRTNLGKWEHMFGNGSSPVMHGDLAILWCGPNEGKGRNFLLAVNKKTGKTVWQHDESYGSWSTPLIVKVGGQDQLLLGQSRDVKNEPDSKTGFLRGFDEPGVPRCYDLKSGKQTWKVEKRPGDMTWGSMVHAEARLYVLMRNGETLVFAANPKYELVAVNSLGGGENTNSSLAISNGDIFIRTFRHLWCIGAGAPQTEAP